MTQGIIKRDRVVLPGGTAPSPLRSSATPCKKSVRTLLHDGLARALEITCSCGETTLVELEIEEKSQS